MDGSTKHVYHKALARAAETHSALKVGSAATNQLVRSYSKPSCCVQTQQTLHLGCFEMAKSYDSFERHVKAREVSSGQTSSGTMFWRHFWLSQHFPPAPHYVQCQNGA